MISNDFIKYASFIFQAVGLSAKQGLIRNATNTITAVKSLLGSTFDDPTTQELIKKLTAKVGESTVSMYM